MAYDPNTPHRAASRNRTLLLVTLAFFALLAIGGYWIFSTGPGNQVMDEAREANTPADAPEARTGAATDPQPEAPATN